MEKLLVVEDDEVTAAFLADNLEADGFYVATAAGVGEAVRAIEVRSPALVILDVMLEDGKGRAVLARLGAADSGPAVRMDPALPVLVLSGRAAEVDRVRGFARGADDYVVKPFSYPELVGRVRAILRRMQPRVARGRLRVGDLEGDPGSRDVRLRGRRGGVVPEGVGAVGAAAGGAAP